MGLLGKSIRSLLKYFKYASFKERILLLNLSVGHQDFCLHSYNETHSDPGKKYEEIFQKLTIPYTKAKFLRLYLSIAAPD